MSSSASPRASATTAVVLSANIQPVSYTHLKAVLVNLDISVPDKEQAEIMCNHWKDRSQEIYAYVMKSLMSEHGMEKK